MAVIVFVLTCLAVDVFSSERMLPIVSLMTHVGIYNLVVRDLLVLFNTTNETKFGSQGIDSHMYRRVQGATCM